MRKTTICRSNSILVAGAVLACTVGTASAQDTLQTGAQSQQQPQVHVVSEGETLWSISQQYLGDPFLWPEIYRLNTLVVEDPHWIFPGEELRLAPADMTAVAEAAPADTARAAAAPPPQEVTQAAPQQQQQAPPEPQVEAPAPVAVTTPPPPPPSESAPTVFMAERTTRGGASLRSRVNVNYRAIRRGEFYAAGFLTQGDALPWGSVLGAVDKPTLGALTATSSAQIFTDIEIEPPAGARYQTGDSLLLARREREVRGGWGRVIVPTGIAVVRNVGPNKVTAEVVRQFNRVADGQVAIPLEPFRDPGNVVPVPVEGGMEGTIITTRDQNPLTGQQDIVFLDLGSQDGVALGDVFAVVRPVLSDQAETSWEQIGELHIVHVRSRSSSGMVIGINGLGVEPGAKVRLIRKMPS